jgi:hypothetical protein
MTISRRKFLGAAGAGLAAASLAPLIRTRRAHAGGEFQTRRVVVLAIAGGVRLSESLGMAQGATMPNLFGDIPLIPGFGAGPAGPVNVAPEYAAVRPPVVVPTPLSTPLYEQGALITNLRYAEGAPGHLQGHACLVSGFYNNLENRSDARLPVPTIFEIHRRETNAPATDAWYLSVPGGFYRALQSSDNPSFGSRFGGSYMSPPGVMSAIVPLVTSGKRELNLTTGSPFELPAIPDRPAEAAAVRRLAGILDGNAPQYAFDNAVVRATEGDNAAFQDHVAQFYADTTYQSFLPDSVGIGYSDGDGGVNGPADMLTVYHAERVLETFQPAVTVVSLLDVDTCHADFNGYLRAQQVADAAVRHLWEFIQSTDGLRDETTLIVMPEHGRHLFFNGQNPDSLGRSGLDHGEGDNGDRDVWMLALGPDIKPGTVVAPTGITQAGRISGRYETIDAIMLASTLLGHGDVMTGALEDHGARPGLVIEEVLA